MPPPPFVGGFAIIGGVFTTVVLTVLFTVLRFKNFILSAINVLLMLIGCVTGFETEAIFNRLRSAVLATAGVITLGGGC